MPSLGDAAVVEVTANTAGFKESLTKGIQPGLDAAVKAAETAGDQMGERLFRDAQGRLRDSRGRFATEAQKLAYAAAQGVGTGSKSITKALLAPFAQAFRDIAALNRQMVGQLGSSAVLGLARNAASRIANSVTSTISNVWSKFTALPLVSKISGAVSSAASAASGFASTVTNTIRSVWDRAGDLASRLVSPITGAISAGASAAGRFASSVVGTVANVWNSSPVGSAISGWVSSAASTVRTAASAIGSDVVTFIGKPLGRLVDIGRNAMGGFIGAAKAAASRGAEVAQQFIGSLRRPAEQAASEAGGQAGERFADDFSRRSGDGVKRKLPTALKVALGAGAAVVAAAGAAMTATLTGGFSRLSGIEDAKAKMDGLGYSTKEVESIMDSADKAATDTKFGLDAVAAAAAGAVAAGVKQGQPLTDWLKLTADTAQITGRSIEDMGYMLNQVQTTGKLTGDVLFSLENAGLSVTDQLAKSYGVNRTEMKQMISDGEVDAAKFQEIMTDYIGGAATAAGGTVTSAMANIRNAVRRVGAAMLEPAYPQFRDLLLGIKDVIKLEVSPIATELGVVLGKVAAEVLPKVLDVIKQLLPLLASNLMSVLPDLLRLFGDLAIMLADSLAAVLPPLINLVVSLASSLAQALTPVLPVIMDLLAQVATLLSGSLAAVLPPLVEMIGQLAGIIGGALAQVLPPMIEFLSGFASLVGGVLAQALPPLMAMLSTLANSIFPVLGEVLSAVMPFVTALANMIGKSLIAVLPLLNQLVQAAAEVFNALLPPLMELINAALPVVILLMEQLLEPAMALINAVLPVMVDLFKAVGPAIKMILEAFAPLVPMFLDMATSILPKLITPFLQIAQQILPPLIKVFTALIPPVAKIVSALLPPLAQVAMALLPVLLSLIDPLLSLIKGFLPFLELLPPIADLLSNLAMLLLPTLSTVMKVLAPIIALAAQVVVALADAFWPIVEQLLPVLMPLLKLLIGGLAALIGWAAQLAEWLAGKIGPALEVFASGVGWLSDVISGFVSGVAQKIIDWLKSMYTWAQWLYDKLFGHSIFPDMQKGLKVFGDFFKKIFDGVAAVFRWVWNNVIKPTGNLIIAGIRAIGTGLQWVWQNLIKPTIDAWAKIFQWIYNNVIKPVAAWIRESFRLIGSTLSNVWKNTISKVFGWFTSGAQGIRDTASRVFSQIRGFFNDLGTGLYNRYLWIRDKVLGGFSRAVTNMKEGFRTAVDAIGRLWNRIKELALAPIRFVLDTVINKGLIGPEDGSGGGFNKLAKFFGVDPIKQFAVPFARGGIAFPGQYTPGRDIGLAAVSGGEPIMRPEFGRAVGTGWVDEANRAARTAGVAGVRRFMGAFAGGGTVQPVPGQGNRHTSGYPWATWAGDFPNPTGTPVKAWKDGIVAAAKHLTTSYGEHVRMNHDDGSSSLYAHLSRIMVTVGQRLMAGSVLGLVGSTGNSTGPHLHFETMGQPYEGGGGDSPIWGFIDDFKNTITAPLQTLTAKYGDNAFTQMLAKAPKKLLDGAVSWVTDKAGQVFDKAIGWITGASSWVGAKVGAFSKDQLNNAATIINVANQLGFGDRGAIIGLMTALQESTLRNLSGGDRDSVGLFQQRAPWGSFADRTNPAKSASMFFNGGQGGQPGLRAFNWRSMGLGQAAQKVQVSAFPSAYDKWEDEARQLVAKATKSGLAAGTLNASRGPHLVGENGPEILWASGGEAVMPAGLTRAMTAGGSGAGTNLVAGFVNGLLSASRQAADAARRVAVGAVDAIKDELGIASPSKTMAQIGVWINQGLAQGLTGSTSTVTSTIKTLATNVTKAFEAQGQAMKNTMVDKYAAQVAKLKPLASAAASAQTKLVGVQKKLADAQKKQVSEAAIKKMEQQATVKSSASAQVIKLSDQLTVLRRQLRDTGTAKKDQAKRTVLQGQIDTLADSLTRARRQAVGAKSLLSEIERAKKSRATVTELQSQVNSLSKLAKGNKTYATQLAQAQKRLAAAKKIDIGGAAVTAGQAMMKQFDALTKRINANAAARAAAAAAIKAAQEDLAEAVKVRDDYKQAIHDQVAQAADLGTLASATESWQITETLQARLDSWRAFAKQLATLKGLGISNTAYQQIVESGPSSGVAQALISGGKAAVAQVNFLQSEIDRVGTSLGNNASKTLYQAGVDSAKGLLQGLQSDESALEKQATKLANDLVAAVKKALKIKSPSQVTTEVGVNVGQGLADGLTSQIGNVSASGSRLAEAAIPVPTSTGGFVAEWGRLHAATPATPATASGPTTMIGTLKVELRLEDLEQLRDVDHLMQIINRTRVRARTTARSGSVTAG